MKTLAQRLSDRFDWWVYWLFYRRWVKRIEREPGWGLLMKLWIEDALIKHPPTEDVRTATVSFYETQRDTSDVRELERIYDE